MMPPPHYVFDVPTTTTKTRESFVYDLKKDVWSAERLQFEEKKSF